MRLRLSSLLLLLCACVSARVLQSHEYEDCSGNHGTTLEIDIDPCPSTAGTTCEVNLGGLYTAIVYFRPARTITNATNAIYGIYDGIHIPWGSPYYDVHACDHGLLDCHVVPSGNIIGYKDSVYIPKISTSIGQKIKWAVMDQDHNAFICFIFDVSVV